MVHLLVTGLVRSFIYMKKTLKRIRTIKSPKEVERILSVADKYALRIITIGPGGDYRSENEYLLSGEHKGYQDCIVINQKESTLEITTSYYDSDLKTTTYKFNLNMEDDIALTGHKAYSIFQMYYKVVECKDYDSPEINEKLNPETNKYIFSASPLVDFNPKFNKKELHNVYEYDLNSAYASVLIKKTLYLEKPYIYPDTEVVKKGQIGFWLDDKCSMVRPGKPAQVIFDEIESPEGLKNFCQHYYDLKKNSTGEEKETAKGMLNYPIGYLQRKNPFLRSYIVSQCNEVIENIIDENTICWNTDAIFSTVRRPDLEIGNTIGKFKEVPIKVFRMVGNTYQIDDDDPVHRGVVKEYYKRFKAREGRAFNLLTDKLTMEDRKCKYTFNFKTLRLEKNYEETN